MVAYDNMDASAREKLATAAEVLANLDVLIEIGQVTNMANTIARATSKYLQRRACPALSQAPCG